VTTFKPESNRVVTADGKEIEYDYLIVAAGLQIDWSKIKGLKESIGEYFNEISCPMQSDR
jgi:sulfide:quinone oxidoreductase